MIIRQAETKDYELIYHVVKAAFEHTEQSDGNEQDLILALRKSKAFIPELSLVAEDDGKIVGHILFTEAEVGDKVQLALAPLSVLPEYQRRGIGTALIKEGHKKAGELGYGYSIVLGSETYYPKMGYLPAKTYGIKPPFAVPDRNFMAYQLREDAPDSSGTIQYADEFEIN